MSAVDTALETQAESIFTDLGYTVTTDGREMRASRKWRVVHVTPMAEPEQPPAGGTFRCFVTWSDRVSPLERRIARADPDYEWAVIGVNDDDYVVSRSSTRDNQ